MRLIDATPEVCEPYLYDHLDDLHMIAAQNAIDDMPTVDAVEVVRCRDCKFWNPYRSHHYKGHYCDVVTLFVQENEYCAWGKRREEEHDAAEH